MRLRVNGPDVAVTAALTGAGPMPNKVLNRIVGSVQGARTTDPVFALTFDDGPHPANTPRLLRVLADHGARATFFVLTERAASQLALLTDLLAAGHEIALHGRDHTDLTTCSRRDIVLRIRGSRDRLEQLIARPVTLFRPPYGTQSWFSYAVARSAGLEVIGWSASPRDFLDVGLDGQVALGLGELVAGGIMLMHDGGIGAPEHRAQMLSGVVLGAASRGLAAVTVTELLQRGLAIRQPWFLRRALAMKAELRPFYLHPESGQG